MVHLMVSEDLINEISRLQQEYEKVSDDLDNPIVGLITPEWYYSDSFRILSNIDINWEALGRFHLIQNIADNLNEISVNNAANGDEFEASFCSWYQPYHYEPRAKWGIHIRYHSWLMKAAHFNQTCPNLISNPINSVKAAFLYLFIHTLFHYVIENATSIMEVIMQNPHIYTFYISSVYAEVFNTYNCLEESLANSYLLTRSDLCHIEKYYLKKELLKQGPGYNNFVNYYDELKFSYGSRKLISQIRFGKLNPSFILPIEQIMNITSPVGYHYNNNRIPIWLHKRARPVHDGYV